MRNEQFIKLPNQVDQGIDEIVCENVQCLKRIHINPVSSEGKECVSSQMICSCCCGMDCVTSFDSSSIHQYETKKHILINNDKYNTPLPCQRCNLQSAIWHCANCNSQYFCQDCNNITHSGGKFAFHTVSMMIMDCKDLAVVEQHNWFVEGNLRIDINNNTKKSNKISNQQSLDQKIQLSLSRIKLKTSQLKLAQLSMREKWQRVDSEVTNVFKQLQQRLKEKQQTIKHNISQQLSTAITQLTLISNHYEKIKREIQNVKSLLTKNCLSVGISKFIEEKMNQVEENVNRQSIRLTSLLAMDGRMQLSRQLMNMFKQKVEREIDSLAIHEYITTTKNVDENENENDLTRQSKNNLDLRLISSINNKKKSSIKNSNNTNKNSYTTQMVTTRNAIGKRSINNIAFLNNNSNNKNKNNNNSGNGNKCKKFRKISIDLNEITNQNNQKQMENNKMMARVNNNNYDDEKIIKQLQLQRIKSLDMLQTMGSLSSLISSQQDDNKMTTENKKNNDSPPQQEYQCSNNRISIDDCFSNDNQQQLHTTANAIAKTNNNNSFSATILATEMKSPADKVFTSTKAKPKFINSNEKIAKTLNNLRQQFQVNRQLQIKKNINTRMLV